MSGLWEIATCTLVDCGSNITIAYGTATLNDPKNTTYGALATVNCDVGQKSDRKTISCKMTGLWEIATCTLVDCGLNITIANGTATLNDQNKTTYGALATVNCHVDHKSDRNTISCYMTGLWEIATCNLVDCGTPSVVNGIVMLNTAGVSTYNATANVSCNLGYYPDNPVITCREQAMWDNATCLVIVKGCFEGEQKCMMSNGTSYCIDQEAVCGDCGTVIKIASGTATLNDPSNTTYGALATVICDVGFKPDRNTITCSMTGVWEIATCNIVDCGSIIKIADGTATLNDPSNTTYGALATVFCDVGHKPDRNSISCNMTGLWEIATCNLVDCGSNITISNGTATLNDANNTTYGALATVVCDVGHKSYRNTISCNMTGVWEMATCILVDCGQPPTVYNGKIQLDIVNRTTYGATATVNCSTGYKAYPESISCHSSGLWGSAVCEIKDCGQLPALTNGIIQLGSANRTTFGATATVNCSMGYRAYPESISCNSSGLWGSAVCTIYDCGSPPLKVNGIIQPDSANKTTFGETATVNCSTGYLADPESISCNSSGSWDSTVCAIKDCGQLPTITNGIFQLDLVNRTTYGATATVNCSTGYKADPESVSCHSSGLWGSAVCAIKDCGQPSSIDNGIIQLNSANKTTFGETATVICSTGYSANPGSISCNSSGSWSSAVCTIKDCGQLPTITNGLIQPGLSNRTIFGATATVNCSLGYKAYPESISCNSSGLWGSALCKIKDCGQPSSIVNGVIILNIGNKTTFGETATVICSTGYNADPKSISCSTAGSWGSAVCRIKDCGQLPNITHGIIQLDSSNKRTYGATAKVNCSTGYRAYPESITCNSSGLWDSAVCTIQDCGKPQPILNGKIQLESANKTTFGETATVNCSTGYNADRELVSCNYSGSWDNAVCTIKDCGQLPTILNGTLMLVSGKSTYGETATVNCSKGYQAIPTSIICNSSGHWDIAQCIIKDCGPLGTLKNGTLNLTVKSVTTFGASASVTCDAGYNSSKSVIRCESSGLWETASCSIINCGPLPEISNGVLKLNISGRTAYGSAAYLECSSGYKPNKSGILCLDSGHWDTATCLQEIIITSKPLEVVSVGAGLGDNILIIVLCCAGVVWILQLIAVVCLVQRESRHHIKMTGKSECLLALGCIPIVGIPFVIYICSQHNHKYYVEQEYLNRDYNAYQDSKQHMASLKHHNRMASHQGTEHPSNYQQSSSHGSYRDLYDLRNLSQPMGVLHTNDTAQSHNGVSCTNDTVHANLGKKKHHKHYHVGHHARVVKHPDEAETHRSSLYELGNSFRDHPVAAFNIRSFSSESSFRDYSGLN